VDPDTQEWRVWGRSMHPYTLGVWLAVSTVAVYLGIREEGEALRPGGDDRQLRDRPRPS